MATTRRRSAALVLLAIAALAYFNAVSDVFVYDDDLFVGDNVAIRSWRNAPMVLRPSFYVERALAYRPLVMLSYFWDYSLWGLRERGFHFTNFAVHGINAILVLLLAQRAGLSRGVSLVGALAFALHPVQAEAVNGVAFREEMLCLLFVLCAALFSSAPRRWPLAALAVIFAALSKETGVLAVPLAITAYHVLGTGKPAPRASRPWLISLAAIAFALAPIILWSLWKLLPESGAPAVDMSLSDPAALIPVLARYAGLAAVPHGLSVDHGLRPAQLTFGSALGMTVLLGGLMAGAAWARGQRVLRFGLVWLAVMAIPLLVSAFTPIPVAERRMYGAIVGFGLLASWVGSQRLAIPKARAATAVFCLMLISFAALTTARNNAWRGSHALWRSAVATSPNSYRARNNLGTCYYTRGAISMALKQCHVSLALNPQNAEALYNLGSDCLLRQGSAEKAIPWYERALAAKPSHAGARLNLGEAYRRAGRLDDAVAQFQRLLSAYPDNAQAHNNLGVCYEQKGLAAEAAAEYERALAIDPAFEPARVNLRKLRGRQ
ncbi:MAG: tetratricopeptide repeat protein [Planctomycetes bacterium]|nr:tetratricopeptide repeat protein [Planctomycetota bacterium]